MKKIGIVTTPRELNYGAVLQAYALQDVISNYGYDTKLIWWSNQKKTRRDIRCLKILGMLMKIIRHPTLLRRTLYTYGHSFSKEYSKESIIKFDEFENKYLNIDFKNYYQMYSFAYSSDCKAIIAGSDQIWNSYAMYVDPFYYLRFVPKDKRIAYAPSFGKNDIPQYNRKRIKKYMQGFTKISVREESGKKILYDLIHKSVPVVLDPSLLLKSFEWERLESYVETPTKYVLMYFLDEPNKESIRILKKIVNQYKMPIIVMPYRFEIYKEFKSVEFVDAGPSDFLYLIHHAEFVLTDSFHGTAFSINYKKEFLVFDRQYGNNQTQISRITDLLNKFGLLNRFIFQTNETIGKIEKIDYSEMDRILEKERIFSINYLSDFLN